MINKDTQLYGSFSENPGNNGCLFFNDAFQRNNINAIYKSFSAQNVQRIVYCTKALPFAGFALSMPFKKNIVGYLNDYEEEVMKIGSCNTVVVKDEKLYGYNTDWIGVYKFFKNKDLKHVNVIGTGGFANSIMYAFSKLGINFSIVKRKEIPDIDSVENQYFINATPADISSDKNIIFDARPFTDVGKEIFTFQAKEQFKIYTGIEYV